jgi:hypothetical protein
VMFSSFMLVFGCPDLSSSVAHSLPSQKHFTHCKLLFTVQHYPRKLALISVSRSLLFVRCSISSSDILAAAHQNTRRQ